MKMLSFPTPVGRLFVLEEEGRIVRVGLPDAVLPDSAEEKTPVLLEARRQLLEYLSGERTLFTLPLSPAGTEFQREVWAALEDIPYGETRSYGQLAAVVGRPKGSRAVGQANHCNPIPILIPCHRVVGADGSLTGYGGGLDLKRRLLELEQGKESMLC